MDKFEQLGRELLRHKYLYYIKCSPEISDYAYDMLERDYIKLAGDVQHEPTIHLIADWNEKWAGTVVDFPFTHPWAKETAELVDGNL